MQTIYMVGHSNHPPEVFRSLLIRHRIGFLIDVRSSPRSRFAWFSNPAFHRMLERWDIKYAHFPTLGGRNPIEGAELESEIKSALEAAEFILDRRAAMMCSEGNPDDCHRRSSLEPVIEDLGYTVRQILRNGELEAPRVTQRQLF